MKRLFAVLFALMACAVVVRAEEPSPLPTEIYPHLRDYFPFGVYLAYCPHVEPRLTSWMADTHDAAIQKIFDDFQRHYINAVVAANMQGTSGKNAKRMFDLAYKHRIKAVCYFSGTLFKGMKGNPTSQVPRAVELWKSIIDDFGAHPALLAYLIFDEPTIEFYRPVIMLHKAIREIDPRHPVIFTHQSRPVTPPEKGGSRAIWEAVKMSPVVFSDCYTMYSNRWGRDPWGYGDIGMFEFRRPDPRSHQWPVVQAFGKGIVPTIEEMRVIIYHTLARGAKGIFMYMPGQAVVPHNYRAHVFNWGDPWLSESPLWRELGRIGRYLTSVGPLLVEAEFVKDFPLEVDCRDFELWTPYPAREKNHWRRPAIDVGVFRKGSAHYLIVHNNDTVLAQKGKVKVPVKLGRVYDLYAVAEAGRPSRPTSPLRVSAGKTLLEVKLPPGDGRIFLVGAEKDFENARATVLRHRSRNDRSILECERELLVRSGIRPAAADALLAKADASAGARDYASALLHLAAARRALEEAGAADGKFSAVRSRLDAMRPMFADTSRWLRAHDMLLSAAVRGDEPALAVLLDRIQRLSREFVRLDNAWRAGKAKSIATEVKELLAKVTDLRRRVLDYRAERRLPVRLAVLRDSPPNGEDAAMMDFLAQRVVYVEPVTPSSDGGFVNPDGESRELGKNYDVVWFHYVGGSGRAPFDRMKIRKVPASFRAKEVTAALREFVRAGGGLILSGLAAGYVCELGFEKNAPDDVCRGMMYRADRPEPRRWTGIKPVAAERNHPVFRSLGADGIRLADYLRGQVVFSAAWRRAEPSAGRVLAGAWSDAAEGPPARVAAVVEYAPKGFSGKVMVVGEGIDFERDCANEFSFGRLYPSEGTPFDRLVRNLVLYVR